MFSRGRIQCLEAFREVGFQVIRVFQPDVEADGPALRLPARGRAVRLEGHGEALEATPAVAHAEQAQPVEEGRVALGLEGQGRRELDEYGGELGAQAHHRLERVLELGIGRESRGVGDGTIDLDAGTIYVKVEKYGPPAL